MFLHYLGENELSNFLVLNNRYYVHKISFVVDPEAASGSKPACMNAHGGQFEHFLLKLSSFVSVSDIILL